MKKAKLIALIGSEEGYGYGHFYRILNLKDLLSYYEVETKIIFAWPDESIDLADGWVFLLDKRDVGFPKEIIQKKIKRIALDNRGAGRSQAHLNIDTLPHFDMDLHEFKYSLRHVMLPKFLRRKPSRVNEARIKYLLPSRLKLKRWDGSKTEGDEGLRNMTSEKRHIELQFEHLRNLEDQKVIFTYFGQTLFEGIYMGKKIFMYDISAYHRRLSQYFFRIWSAFTLPGFYFDGKGLLRVCERVFQFLRSENHSSRTEINA